MDRNAIQDAMRPPSSPCWVLPGSQWELASRATLPEASAGHRDRPGHHRMRPWSPILALLVAQQDPTQGLPGGPQGPRHRTPRRLVRPQRGPAQSHHQHLPRQLNALSVGRDCSTSKVAP